MTMIETFHLAALIAFAYLAAIFSSTGWYNIFIKVCATGLAGWAAVIVAMDALL